MSEDLETLRRHGIQPSAQRVAVAAYVLHTDEHPSADEVWRRVRQRFPMVSRATVYNTLHLFTDKGLVRPVTLAEGRVVFDANVEKHHHFVDETTGTVHDVPWEALAVSGIESLEDLQIREHQVVLWGTMRKSIEKERT